MMAADPRSVTPLFRKFLGLHWILFAAMVIMVAMGIYSVYAAVHFRPEPAFSTRWNDQIRWVLIGSVFFFGASLIDYKWVRWASVPLYVVGLGLLVLQGLKGKDVYGQTLSLTIGGVSFQAAQFAITATILLLAVMLGEGHKYIPWLKHYMVRFLLGGMIFGGPFLLVVKQGDLGSAMVLVPIVAAMLLVGNIPFRCLIAVALIGLTVLPKVTREWQRKAFANWYLNEGMSEEQINALRASAQELIQSYQVAEESGAKAKVQDSSVDIPRGNSNSDDSRGGMSLRDLVDRRRA